MNPLSQIVWNFSAKARKKRAKLFRDNFSLNENTKILDLGSENGSNIFKVLQNTKVKNENVVIADIDLNAIEEGKRLYGFNTALIKENERLDFPNNFFDIVYCSSVIEHTTVNKSDIWKLTDGKQFKEAAWEKQKTFAEEIVRLGKQYFVQTPCKTFPIESHTWLPFVGYLPREVFLPILRVSNRYWIKQADPDFNLLGEKEMQKLFPNARILSEKKFGVTKSIMAIKTDLEKM